MSVASGVRLLCAYYASVVCLLCVCCVFYESVMCLLCICCESVMSLLRVCCNCYVSVVVEHLVKELKQFGTGLVDGADDCSSSLSQSFEQRDHLEA